MRTLYEYHSKHRQWPGTEEGVHALLTFFIEHQMKRLHPDTIVRGLATGITYNATSKYCTCGFTDNADLSFNAESHVPKLVKSCAYKPLGNKHEYIHPMELVELAYMALKQWSHKDTAFLKDYLYSMCTVSSDTNQCAYFCALYNIAACTSPWSSILCTEALKCERNDLQYFAHTVNQHIQSLLPVSSVRLLPDAEDISAPWLLTTLMKEPFVFVSRQWLWVLTQRFITYAHIELSAVIHDGRKSADLHIDNTMFLIMSRRDKALLICYYIWLASVVSVKNTEAPPNLIELFSVFSVTKTQVPIGTFIHTACLA